MSLRSFLSDRNKPDVANEGRSVALCDLPAFLRKLISPAMSYRSEECQQVVLPIQMKSFPQSKCLFKIGPKKH